MAYSVNKEGEIIINNFEQGIAVSPHKGIANIQNGNIATESGEVMASFARVQQTETNSSATFTLTPQGAFYFSSSISFNTAGFWITAGTSSVSSISSSTNYYVSFLSSGQIQLSAAYDPTHANPISHGTTGSITGCSILRNIGKPIFSAVEPYSDGSSFQTRYYVLDANGAVWVNDTAISTSIVNWSLPDFDLTATVGSTSLVVLNGWLLVFNGSTIWCKSTSLLGATPGWVQFSPGGMLTPATGGAPHYAFVGHQGRCYYTDGNFIGSIFPNSSLVSSQLAITAPGASTGALAGTGAGLLSNGAYIYKITFVNSAGETVLGTASNTVTVTDYTTNGKVNLTSIPVSGDATVNARKIYRTTVGGSSYYFLATLLDNVTTTYTDNTPDTSLGVINSSTGTSSTPIPNIQSYASYTSVTTTGTISALIGGSLPTTAVGGATIAIPVIFFTAGTIATDLQPGGTTKVSKVFYIKYSLANSNFQVFSSQSNATAGINAIDIATGASGTQYFNTFYPTSTPGTASVTFTPQRVNLPFFEIAQCMVEVGNTVLIGCKSNILYPWNQVDVLPGDIIPLPENNVVNMITVNNMAYVFAGNKGNIYVTNGNTASAVITVPDYCAGAPGTPTSYIEPYFVWGGAMYLRGRVYFSALDQTTTKTGNCGGIWSFVPTQNFFIGQNTGLSLRIENQSSYGSYNGYATVLIASQNQVAQSPQYWSGWESSISSSTYGIDFTDTAPSSNFPCIVETDLIPTGTSLNKKTFNQIEYKLAAPLTSGESVTMQYRQNSTDVWTSCGTAQTESATGMSGVFPVVFQTGQWIQLRATLNPIASNSSFVRLNQIILR